MPTHQPHPDRLGLTMGHLEEQMELALSIIRRGATPDERALAIDELDRALADAARLTSVSWKDAQLKGEMVQVALAGRNAKAARLMLASLARDLEHLPPKGSLLC